MKNIVGVIAFESFLENVLSFLLMRQREGTVVKWKKMVLTFFTFR